jgi:hypothetical protein
MHGLEINLTCEQTKLRTLIISANHYGPSNYTDIQDIDP